MFEQPCSAMHTTIFESSNNSGIVGPKTNFLRIFSGCCKIFKFLLDSTTLQ